MTDHELHDLAAAYALDALDDGERTAFEAHYEICEICVAEVAGFRETTAKLVTDGSLPPEHLEVAIVQTIAHTQQVPRCDDDAVVDLRTRRRRRQVAGDGEELPNRRRFNAVRLVQAAAVLAVFATGILVGINRTDDRSTTTGEIEYAGAIDTASGPIGQLSVTATGIGRVIDFETDALPILPTGEYYELWFVAPDDTVTNPDRISAGTFHPDADGNVEVQFAAAVDPSLYPTVEITAEPGDGDPAATGPVVARTMIEP